MIVRTAIKTNEVDNAHICSIRLFILYSISFSILNEQDFIEHQQYKSVRT